MTNLSDYFDSVLPKSHQYAITNHDCETGDMTGWTDSIGTGFEARSTAPVYEGTYSFYGGAQLEAESYQDIVAIAGDFTTTDIDSGKLQFTLKYAHTSYDGDDKGHVRINFLDESDIDISIHDDPVDSAPQPQSPWLLREQTVVAPAGTRTVRISMHGYRTVGTGCNAHIDDITLEGKTLA